MQKYLYFCTPKKNNSCILMKKNDRMAALRAVIARKELSSQEEVIQALALEGFTVTQSTLSRDMNKLKIVKKMVAAGRSI